MKIPAALLLAAICVPLSAGPPFKTDDPEPVDLGHLELYLFSLGDRISGATSGLGPAVEFNYGILKDTQFHVIVPYAFNRPPDAPAEGGMGDIEVGIKYRFISESGTRPQIGTFPLVEIPSGNAAKGLGAGHTQIYLPVWAQKSWGPWTTYGGYGWWRNPGAGNRNWNYLGWLVQRDLGKHLTLGAEATYNTAVVVGGRGSTGFDAGGQVNLSEKHHILFSLGHSVAGERQAHFYVGYQLTTGTYGNLGDWFRHRQPRT